MGTSTGDTQSIQNGNTKSSDKVSIRRSADLGLAEFVAETGGELLRAAPDKIEAGFTQLMDQLAASYSLAYLPTNPIRDGKRRRLRVELAPAVEQREGKVVLLTRRSYLMPKDK